MPPTELTVRAAALRDEIVAELEARGAMEPAKMPAVLRYARTLDLAWRAWERIPAHAVLGRTDRGGQRVHPAISVALQAEEAAMRFGQALGVEPTIAKRPVGRPKAAASAPDRTATPKLRMVR